MHGAGAGIFRQGYGQHLEQNAIDVVLCLRLGEPERVDLHAIAEEAIFRVRHAVALARDFVPKLGECAHLAHLGDEAHAGVDEERYATDHLAELGGRNFTGRFHGIEDCDGRRQRVSEFLHRRRSGFLQMVGADVRRIPLRHGPGREDDGVLDEPQRRFGREHVGAARQVFLDDIVLNRAGELVARGARLIGNGDIERQQPGGGRVDRHRRVHLLERNAVEQCQHIAEMRDRNADFADFAARQLVIGVVAGLRREIEGDREAGLTLAEILLVKLI